GKSVVATNTAVTLATNSPNRVALVDGDLQFGDVAVLLGIPPLHTTSDAAAAIENADEILMEGLLATHEASSLRVLSAPVEPSAGDKITPEEMVGIIRMLRRMFDYIGSNRPLRRGRTTREVSGRGRAGTRGDRSPSPFGWPGRSRPRAGARSRRRGCG